MTVLPHQPVPPGCTFLTAAWAISPISDGGTRITRLNDLSGRDARKSSPLPDNVDFWVGVIDVKSTICEPVEQIGTTTDCGLILLQRYIANDTQHALAQGTKLVRVKLAANYTALQWARGPTHGVLV